MFFVWFGGRVLISPDGDGYVLRMILLLAGTGLLLAVAAYLYQLLDRTPHASLRFGFIGTIVGLLLDTWSLSNYASMFPGLDEKQVIAFTAWMSFAYALYLIIPALLNTVKK
nr:DUF5367 family protein [Ectobacillus ponti]